MSRRVQVHPPTAIALDAERGERRLKRGCIVQTTEDNVVLRNGENSLCVVDANSFCAGSLDVRREVELPQNITFSRKSSGKYGIAWDNRQEEDAALSRAVHIVDYQTGEVTTRALPTVDEEIANVFVDSNGEQIVVVGATTGNLYGWSRYNRDFNENVGRWGLAEWRLVDASVLDSIPVDVCSCGWFVSSAVMGNCCAYLRARRHSIGSVIVEKWILDVDAQWIPVSFSSRTLEVSTSDPAEELALHMTENWQFVIMTTDKKILDGAWINQNAAFAMLLANGQISIASVSDTGCFELLGIMTSNTMSKRLSLSALLGKAVSVARQVVWVVHEEQVIVDFETSCAAFKLSIIDKTSSSNTANHSNKSAELFLVGTFARYNRRVMTRRHMTNFGDSIRKLLDRKSSPSTNELLDAARISLTRNQTVFEDMYFLLLCNIHQQLVGDSVSKGNSRDPIDCIGKSLKLMELLVSFTISMEATTLRQISSRILSAVAGGAAKTDRNEYFRQEIIIISQLLRKLQCAVSESDDWWIHSREMAVFLRVYFTPTHALLQKIFTNAKLKSEEASQMIVLCQRIIEQEDGSAVAESASNSETVSDSLTDQLTGLLASYTSICRLLHVNGVMIDLEHYFSLVAPIMSTRQEMLCCFIKPWTCIRVVDKTRPAIAESLMIQAVRFAIKSNTLQLLLNFSIASGSRIVHSCIQALCNAAEICAGKTEVEASVGVLKFANLHWLACESYIGEAMGILHRIGPRRQFKYSNPEAEYSTDCLSHAVQSNFDDYYRNLSAELAKTTENCRVAASTSSLWECSQFDELLCARVVCLLSRIIWHLEAATNDCISLVQRAFVMNLFDSRLSKEYEVLHDCITKVRAIINPNETELRLPRFPQHEDDQLSLPIRPKRIVRSLVLIAWILWLREKAAICSRSAHIGKTRDNSRETESLGALFATCALHLNALRTICGDNEGLLAIQMELLEEASTMNPHQTAAVISWGFSARKIPTRYLKRYYGLRQAVQRSVSLEENEYQCQQLQKHIRREFHHIEGTLLNEELNHDDNREIDVLMGCCCDPEFLQIISVLTKCPCEVVTITHAAPPLHESKTFMQEYPENSQGNVETGLATTADPERAAFYMSEQHVEDRKSESLISRDEVIALLQEQTRHLEEKIHAVKVAGQPRPSGSHEGDQSFQTEDTPPFSDRGKAKVTSDILPGKVDVTREPVVDLPDVQRMAQISLQVRDLGRHRYSSADKQCNPLSKPAQRHDSVRNALKLFRLRQENGGHARGEQVDLATTNEIGAPDTRERINAAPNIKATSDSQYPPDVSSRRDAVKRSGVKKKTSRNLHRSKMDCVPPKEPVYPLRLEYGVDNASLKLLGRNSQQRNPSVKRRQFVHHERERQQKANTAHPKAMSASFEPTEEILLKTVSAQTNDSIENIPPASATEDLKELMNTQTDIGPEKESPVMQERDDGKQIARNAANTHNSQKGVGIQCHVTNDSPANGARKKRGQIPLSIADKYPIWIDLDSANNMGARSHFKERKKFLQVARFGDFDTTSRTTNNDATDDSVVVAISPFASTVQERNVEDENDENQCGDHHSPKFSHDQSQDDHTTEQKSESMKDKYRTIYRDNYPVRERLSSRKSDDRQAVGGITSLIDLRADMELMTQRLRVLETCANSIDEEFKVSQKRLTQIGDVRLDCTSSQSKVLEDIDEVLEITEEAGNEVGPRNPRDGLLAKKASRDLGAAKYDLLFSKDSLAPLTDENLFENVNRKLLEIIDQLTISTDG